MIRIPLSSWSAAITASVVGFGGTLAIIIAAANAVGATPDQTASWITAITLAIAIESLALSLYTRMPVVSAYSTAGAALIGASTGFTMAEAVGAFIVTAALLVLTGLVRPLMDLVAKLPTGIASGMLSGILIGFPIAAAGTITGDPVLVLPLVVLFFLARRIHAPTAAIVVLVTGVALAAFLGRIPTVPELGLSRFVFVMPDFTLDALLGIALPLYLVTMASQNLPGLAVLKTFGYRPAPGPLVGTTGLLSLLSAPFCASTTNLSAITASICVSEEAHPDPAKRWVVAIPYALCYALFALFGASISGLVTAMPAVLIALVAGLALLPPLVGSVSTALAAPEERMAAMVTLVVTASGLSVFGIGAAFWGLVAGLLVHLSSK